MLKLNLKNKLVLSFVSSILLFTLSSCVSSQKGLPPLSLVDVSQENKDAKLKQSEASEIKTKIDTILNTEFFNNYDMASLINEDLDRLGLLLDNESQSVKLKGRDFIFIKDKDKVKKEVIANIKKKFLFATDDVYKKRIDTIKIPNSLSQKEKEQNQILMYKKYHDDLIINFKGTRQKSLKDINFELYIQGLLLKENKDMSVSIVIMSDDEISYFIENYEKQLNNNYKKVIYLINYYMVDGYKI